MWIFDGEHWEQDHDAGSRTSEESVGIEIPLEDRPELEAIELSRPRVKQGRRNGLPWMKP